MSHSKLADITAAKAEEARTAPVPSDGPAEALAALRAPLQKRQVRALPVWAGAAAVVGIALALTAIPRSSEASRLLSLLEKEQTGIVHEVHYVISSGRLVKDMEIYKDGRAAKIVNPDGGEQLVEPGRSTMRDPQGFIWSEKRDISASFASGPDLVSFLKSDPKAKVTRNGSRYTVTGAFTDGQGIYRNYSATMTLDDQNRPVLEEIEHQGLGKSRIEFSYEGKSSDLQLAPVAKDRIYDLTAQRAELEAKLKELKPGETGVVSAYVDESGTTGVLLAVPEVVSRKNELVQVGGDSMEPVSLSFNGWSSVQANVEQLRAQLAVAQASLSQTRSNARTTEAAQVARTLQLQIRALQDQVNAKRAMELDVPVEYGGHRLFLKTLKTPKNLKTPFTLQFPFWKYDAAFKTQHPLLDANSTAQPLLIGTNTYVVPKVEKTSSLTFLLCPLNVPFFQNADDATGGATKTAGKG